MTAKRITLQQLQRLYEKEGKAFQGAVAAALAQKGEQIMADSQKIVPVDTTRLQKTGYVAPPRGRGIKLIVEIGYATEYALTVHEGVRNGKTMNFRNGRQAGYLRKPMENHKKGLLQWVGKKAVENWKEGVVYGSGLSGQFPTFPKDTGKK